MIWDKKKLIVVGGIFLLLILILISIPKKTKTTTQVSSDNKDFDTKGEPTNTPTPTLKPTATPTLKPTATPMPTATPEPTMIPTITPTPTNVPVVILIPTKKPTKKPTATPTIDTNIYATGVVLTETEITLTINESRQIKARVEPNETTNQSIYWSSSDGNIATVTNDGWIIGKSLGVTTITAKTSNNKTTIVKVNVINRTPTVIVTATPTPVDYPTRIDLSLSRLILKVGEAKQLYVKYQPMNIRNKTVTWSTSDSNIVTVSNTGLVTGKKLGTATITVKTANNLSQTATVVVSAN
jgi:uncharacterized protein YjdB